MDKTGAEFFDMYEYNGVFRVELDDCRIACEADDWCYGLEFHEENGDCWLYFEDRHTPEDNSWVTSKYDFFVGTDPYLKFVAGVGYQCFAKRVKTCPLIHIDWGITIYRDHKGRGQTLSDPSLIYRQGATVSYQCVDPAKRENGNTKRCIAGEWVGSDFLCNPPELTLRPTVAPNIFIPNCTLPQHFCSGANATYTYRDCDGDGYEDHVCEDGDLFGVLQGSQDCLNTWPNGYCEEECICKTYWDNSKDLGDQCALQRGCTNCDNDPKGTWCHVANRHCQSEENKDGWSYCSLGFDPEPPESFTTMTLVFMLFGIGLVVYMGATLWTKYYAKHNPTEVAPVNIQMYASDDGQISPSHMGSYVTDGTYVIE